MLFRSADNASSAVSCTGHGEYFIRHIVAYNLCSRVKLLKESIQEAADHIIFEELNEKEGNGGLIAVDRNGILPCHSTVTACFVVLLKKKQETAISLRRSESVKF